MPTEKKKQANGANPANPEERLELGNMGKSQEMLEQELEQEREKRWKEDGEALNKLRREHSRKGQPSVQRSMSEEEKKAFNEETAEIERWAKRRREEEKRRIQEKENAEAEKVRQKRIRKEDTLKSARQVEADIDKRKHQDMVAKYQDMVEQQRLGMDEFRQYEAQAQSRREGYTMFQKPVDGKPTLKQFHNQHACSIVYDQYGAAHGPSWLKKRPAGESVWLPDGDGTLREHKDTGKHFVQSEGRRAQPQGYDLNSAAAALKEMYLGMKGAHIAWGSKQYDQLQDSILNLQKEVDRYAKTGIPEGVDLSKKLVTALQQADAYLDRKDREYKNKNGHSYRAERRTTAVNALRNGLADMVNTGVGLVTKKDQTKAIETFSRTQEWLDRMSTKETLVKEMGANISSAREKMDILRQYTIGENGQLTKEQWENVPRLRENIAWAMAVYAVSTKHPDPTTSEAIEELGDVDREFQKEGKVCYKSHVEVPESPYGQKVIEMRKEKEELYKKFEEDKLKDAPPQEKFDYRPTIKGRCCITDMRDTLSVQNVNRFIESLRRCNTDWAKLIANDEYGKAFEERKREEKISELEENRDKKYKEEQVERVWEKKMQEQEEIEEERRNDLKKVKDESAPPSI